MPTYLNTTLNASKDFILRKNHVFIPRFHAFRVDFDYLQECPFALEAAMRAFLIVASEKIKY
jgi:hypothetical protein